MDERGRHMCCEWAIRAVSYAMHVPALGWYWADAGIIGPGPVPDQCRTSAGTKRHVYRVITVLTPPFCGQVKGQVKTWKRQIFTGSIKTSAHYLARMIANTIKCASGDVSILWLSVMQFEHCIFVQYYNCRCLSAFVARASVDSTTHILNDSLLNLMLSLYGLIIINISRFTIHNWAKTFHQTYLLVKTGVSGTALFTITHQDYIWLTCMLLFFL